MRSLKLKSVDDGRMCLQHPRAELGFGRGGVVTIQIDGIPDGKLNSDVVRLANLTVFAFTCFGAGRLRYDFGEMGVGRIICD